MIPIAAITDPGSQRPIIVVLGHATRIPGVLWNGLDPFVCVGPGTIQLAPGLQVKPTARAIDLPCVVSAPWTGVSLIESYIPFHFRSEQPPRANAMEPFHFTVHDNCPRRPVITIPSAKARHRPTRPCQASRRVRVALPRGFAFQERAERFDRVHLRLGEHLRCRGPCVPSRSWAICMSIHAALSAAAARHRGECQLGRVPRLRWGLPGSPARAVVHALRQSLGRLESDRSPRGQTRVIRM